MNILISSVDFNLNELRASKAHSRIVILIPPPSPLANPSFKLYSDFKTSWLQLTQQYRLFIWFVKSTLRAVFLSSAFFCFSYAVIYYLLLNWWCINILDSIIQAVYSLICSLCCFVLRFHTMVFTYWAFLVSFLAFQLQWNLNKSKLKGLVKKF